MDHCSEIMDIGSGSDITDDGLRPFPTTERDRKRGFEGPFSKFERLGLDALHAQDDQLPAGVDAPPGLAAADEGLRLFDVSEFEPLSKTEYDMLHTAYPGPSGALPITGKAVVLRGSVARQLKRKGITSVVPRIRWEPLHEDIKHCLPILKKR